MIVVFDVDNTLYEEVRYVRSGFRAVAQYLDRTFGVPALPASKFMWDMLQSEGRGRIFDLVLRRHNLYSKKNVRSCLSIYRLHRPTIVLDADARRCLRRFRHHPIYIVTDGNTHTQKRKIEALGLTNIVKKAFITHHYGRKHAKPSPYCFEKIAMLENVSSSSVVYIGDDPKKDFVGLKPLGFKTIRVLKGPHKHLHVQGAFDAAITIRTLDELNEKVLFGAD